MAIAPIDLQTMYSQMGHLAKVAADQQNGSHLAQQLQETRRIQQDAERAKQIKKTADHDSKALAVGKDGKRGGSAEHFEEESESGEEKESTNAEVSPQKTLTEIRESYLGTMISIES